MAPPSARPIDELLEEEGIEYIASPVEELKYYEEEGTG